jgi:6-phosphogluconolactonase
MSLASFSRQPHTTMTDASDASPQHVRWHSVESAEALAETVARRVLATADRAIAERGRFAIVLAGGNTPRAAYTLLRDAAAAWSAWHVYFGDERCAPRDDPGRNSRMADEAWLGSVPIPRAQVHEIATELGPIEGARRYSVLLAEAPRFDLVLLGLGEDGHTASLFPGDETGFAVDAPDAVPVFAAPKPPPLRVSLSARRLASGRHVYFLVAGADKAEALARWRVGASIPAARIRPQDGVDAFVATSAALA